MFMGPAPRSIFKALMRRAPKQDRSLTRVMEVRVEMTNLFHKKFCISLDVYSFQATPCYWRPYTQIVRRALREDRLPTRWKTQHRILAERVFRLETLRWQDLQRALLSAGLSNVVLSAEIKLQLADMLVDEAVARVSSMITATTATTGVEELLREQYAVPRRLLCWRHTPAYLTGNDLRDLQMTHLLDNDMPVSLTGDDVLDVEMSHSTPVAAHVDPTPTSISLDSVAVGGQLPLTMRP
jgi:hypothetical protein